jgi:outer membrane lipopolysaccharide assembly protein LptE/RlpB
MIRFHKQFIIGILLLTLSACGYRFSGGGDLPGGVTRVSLGIFENRSAETGVEGIVGNAIINEFTRNGKPFTHDHGAGSAVLSGRVLSVDAQSISRQSIHKTQEQRVTVAISLRMTDPKGAVVWQISRISENEEYEVAEEKGLTERNKRAAISKLSRRLAEKVYSQMTDSF